MEAQELGSPTGHSFPSDQPKRGRGHGRLHQQNPCGASVVAATMATNNRCPWLPGRPLSRAVRTESASMRSAKLARGKNSVHGSRRWRSERECLGSGVTSRSLSGMDGIGGLLED